MCATLSKPTDRLRVDLEYYDQRHEQLLAQAPYAALDTAKRVKAFQQSGVVPLQDFLNYYYIDRHAGPEFATFSARMAHLDSVSQHLKHAISTAGTLNTLPGHGNLQQEVGEAMALTVASTLFGLTAADWTTIPIKRPGSFDFERTVTAVTGASQVIQVEAKGSFVRDNNRKPSTVSAQAKKITDKKEAIAKAGRSYPFPASARYGVIVSVDPSHDVKCYLLDPPGDQLQGEPLDLKIAFRLEYVASVVALISPKAHLVRALLDRAGLWRQGRGHVPSGTLQSSTGHSFGAGNYVEDFFAHQKVWLGEEDIVGHVFRGRSGQHFFLGLRGDVLRTVIGQDPRQVVDMRFHPASRQATFEARPVRLGQGGKGGPQEFRLTLHTASSGVVIGLPVRPG